MSDKCFLDTNILMYAHDRGAGWKHDRARTLVAELWNSGNGILSTQVLQELCVNLRKRSSRPPDVVETKRLIEDYLSWHVVVNTAESTVRALDIEHRYKISFWDALIIQAAETAGATVLYSEDLSSGQSYASVRVVNPFSTASTP